jgi:hypothetical protein
MNWDEIFGLSVSPIELIVRGSAMYLFLFLLFRVAIRRRIGAVGTGSRRRRCRWSTTAASCTATCATSS